MKKEKGKVLEGKNDKKKNRNVLSRNSLSRVLPPALLCSLALPTTSLEPMSNATWSFSVYGQTNASWPTRHLQTTHCQRTSSEQLEGMPISRHHLPQIQSSSLSALSTPTLPLTIARQVPGSSLLSSCVIRDNVEVQGADKREELSGIKGLEKQSHEEKEDIPLALDVGL